jgi:hypothetical protein
MLMSFGIGELNETLSSQSRYRQEGALLLSALREDLPAFLRQNLS